MIEDSFDSLLDCLLDGLLFNDETISKEDFVNICMKDRKKVLLTCKPKENFHIGNIWMFHKIQQFLLNKFDVEILIILFDELMEVDNENIRILKKKVEYTQDFIRAFFGNNNKLNIKLSTDGVTSPDKLRRYHDEWKSIYQSYKGRHDGNPLSRLITDKGQLWTMDTHAYIPKCVLLYAESEADIVICGEKHDSIVCTFKEISNKLELKFPQILYAENLQDLTNNSPMDNADSIGTKLITLEDYKEGIFTKITNSKPAIRKKWLDSIVSKMLLASEDFSVYGKRSNNSKDFERIFESATEFKYGIILASLINKISKYNKKTCKLIKRNYTISWNDDSISKEIRENRFKRQMIELIIKSIYSSENLLRITIEKEFSEGMGGSRVFQIDSLGKEGNRKSQILKVGDSVELLREKANYDDYINGKKPSTCVSIGVQSEQFGGQLGIVYEHANVFVGNEMISLKRYVEDNIDNSLGKTVKAIDCLFDDLSRLFYLNTPLTPNKRYRDFYNDILPPCIEIRLIKLTKTKNALSPNEIFNLSNADEFDSQKLFSIEVFSILKIDDDEVVFIDENNNKIKADISNDMHFSRDLRAYSNSKRHFTVTVSIKSTRKYFFKQLVECIPEHNQQESEKMIFDGKTLDDPIKMLDQVLNTEIDLVRESTIHGDLNLSNILIAPSTIEKKTDLALIDYQYTKFGFTCFDFIKLEVEFRTQILGGLSFEKYLGFEKLLMNHNSATGDESPRVKNVIEIIKEIRRKHECVNYNITGTTKQYYTGIYLYSLNCIKYFQSDENMKRKLYFTASLYLHNAN